LRELTVAVAEINSKKYRQELPTKEIKIAEYLVERKKVRTFAPSKCELTYIILIINK